MSATSVAGPILLAAAVAYLFNRSLESYKRENSDRLTRLSAELNKAIQANLDTDRAQRAEALEKQKKAHSEELTFLNTSLNKALQEKLEADRAQRTIDLERLKRDLQDTLANRARRAEYLKTQIANLYGPLAFIIELSAHQIGRATDIAFTAARVIGNPNPQATITKQQDDAIHATVQKYYARARENIRGAIKILQSNWGWLDEEDRSALVKFMRNAEYNEIELETVATNILPEALFDSHVLKDMALAPGQTALAEMTSFLRKRLTEKQHELSGFIAHAEQSSQSKERPPGNVVRPKE